MSNSSIKTLDRTLSGASTPGQSGPGSDGNEGVFHIPQSSNITGASHQVVNVISRILIGRGSYTSAEMQSVYSSIKEALVSYLITAKKRLHTLACRHTHT